MDLCLYWIHTLSPGLHGPVILVRCQRLVFRSVERVTRNNRRKHDDGKSDDRRHSGGTADGSIQVSSNGTTYNVPPPCQPVQLDSTFNPSVCKGSVHSKRIPLQSRRKHFKANCFHFRSDFVGFGILSAASNQTEFRAYFNLFIYL